MDNLKLVGECHRCGLCCEFKGYRCLNLIAPAPIGIVPAILPGPTTCRVYDRRYDRMPITLMDARGNIARGECAKDSLTEVATIIETGIGKGCSLSVAEIGGADG